MLLEFREAIQAGLNLDAASDDEDDKLPTRGQRCLFIIRVYLKSKVDCEPRIVGIAR